MSVSVGEVSVSFGKSGCVRIRGEMDTSETFWHFVCLHRVIQYRVFWVIRSGVFLVLPIGDTLSAIFEYGCSVIHCGVVFASPLGDTFTVIFCLAAWRYDLGHFLPRRLVMTFGTTRHVNKMW